MTGDETHTAYPRMLMTGLKTCWKTHKQYRNHMDNFSVAETQ